MLVLVFSLLTAQADELYCVPGGSTLAIIDTNAMTITSVGQAPADSKSGGCGCDTSSPTWAWVVLPLVALARRKP